MEKAIEQEVRRRAQETCEYCQRPQAFFDIRFPIDHIVARQHRGTTTLDNLALCCPLCNRYKGPNLAGIDPLTGQLVPLFNPRAQRWVEHFRWNGAELIGLTPAGRSTVAVLNINRPDSVAAREWLIAEGVFPPSL